MPQSVKDRWDSQGRSASIVTYRTKIEGVRGLKAAPTVHDWFGLPITAGMWAGHEGPEPVTLHDEPVTTLAIPQRTLRIADPEAGVVYEVTLDTDDAGPHISTLTVYATGPGQRIDAALLRRIPTDQLIRYTARRFAEEDEAGRPLPVLEGLSRGRMTDEEFIAHYRKGMSRDDLAAKNHMSVYGIDKWVRRLRDAGHPIPKRKTGRPRQPSTGVGSTERRDNE